MPLLNIVVALIVVGVGLWLINNFIPMASSIKTILNVVVVVAVCVWVLQATGMWGHVSSYRITR
jgi:predicted membrane protein